MPELDTTTKYQLTEAEKTDLVAQLKQSFTDGSTKVEISETSKADIVSQISNKLSSGTLSVNISEADKADIIQEVLAELYAKSQDTATLEKVGNLDGVTSIPAVRDDKDIVAVPLGLLTTNQPQEVKGQQDIDILVAQGKIVPTQIYFTPVDDE